MLGTWRFALAALVALSHTGWRLFGLNPGVVAVVGFYLISGYVMTGLLRQRYPGWRAVPRFYLDRALRLLPLYLSLLLLTLIWLAWSGRHTDFITHAPSLAELAQNVAVVPLNFYMYNHLDRCTLIPPAWSLGAEVQFYLVIPLVLAWRAPFALLSLLVFALAACGVIDPDVFGYRLLPGVLWVFLAGSWLYDAHRAESGGSWRGVMLLLALVGCAALALMGSGHLQLPYDRETLLGISIATLLLQLLGRRPRQRLDEWLGDLSYGVFLSHFLLLWAVFGTLDGWRRLELVGASALLALLLHHLIERPVLRWRQRLRSPA